MHMKSVCIVVLSSEAYLYGIGFVFGVKLMSNCFFYFFMFFWGQKRHFLCSSDSGFSADLTLVSLRFWLWFLCGSGGCGFSVVLALVSLRLVNRRVGDLVHRAAGDLRCAMGGIDRHR